MSAPAPYPPATRRRPRPARSPGATFARGLGFVVGWHAVPLGTLATVAAWVTALVVVAALLLGRG